MSIASEITRITTNIANAYTSCNNKGATMPVTQNSANLATCIDSIPTGGGGSSTKYGVSMDSIIGDVNASGVLQQPSVNGNYVFTGVKDIAITGLQYVGYQKKAIVSVSFPDLENINGMSALYYAFQYSNVASINFPKLETITNDTAMQYAFGYTPLTSASFPELTVITGNNAISYCFAGCSSFTSISFPKLERIGKSTVSQYVSDYGQLSRLLYNVEGVETLTFPELKEVYCTGSSAAYSGTFAYNNKVKKMYFPKLDTITYGSGASTTNQNACKLIFSNCDSLAELHFASANQSAIQATAGYSTLWGRGAGNATVYFDL